ncbi:MAG: sigma factor regulator FecR [bacterium]|nr:sigma factor regulator FecR [bacterium]
MKDKISLIANKIKEGGNNVIFTGAGISTESGIPDFRSQGGIYDKVRPVYFDDFMSSKEARIEYWRSWVERYQVFVSAQPNPAHLALARLHEIGLLQAVVTQNVDGLHQESGLPDEKIIELHGNARRIRCMTCRQIIPTPNVQQQLAEGDPAPECQCGGYLKPDTISYRQSMPVAEVEKAAVLSQESDFFMMIGSTLIVQPAAHMPFYAKDNGAFLAIINLSETPCDEMCDALIQEKAGIVLKAIVEEVERT